MTPLRADEYEIGFTPSFDHDLSGWGGMETDYLRQELEEMEDKVDKYKDLMDLACIEMKQAQDALKAGERRWEMENIDRNNALFNKMNIYLRTIEEYQRIITKYIGSTHVNLVTNELLTLRKTGELDV